MAASIRAKTVKTFHIIRSTVRRILSFLVTVIIIIAAVVTVLYLAGIRPYVVTTGSMEPAIPVHSICFVNENTPLRDISTGDVIAFRSGSDLLVTHRVTEINGGEYTTKGDANNTVDSSAVTSDNYIGKTSVIIPKAGVIIIYLHSRRGKIAAVTIIILLLILSFMPEKKKESPEPEPKERSS